MDDEQGTNYTSDTHDGNDDSSSYSYAAAAAAVVFVATVFALVRAKRYHIH